MRRVLIALASALLVAGCATGRAAPAAPPVPSPGDWSALPTSPLSARHEPTGGWVGGRFVVVGGWTDRPCPPTASCVAPAEPARSDGAAFDPVTSRWTRIADAPVPVSAYSVVVGDRLYVLTLDQGRDDSPVTLLRYDPGADRWATLPLPPGPVPQLVAAGDRLISVGASDEYGPAAVDAVLDGERWTRLPADPLGPSFARGGTWLGDGRLLLTAQDLVASPGAERPPLVRLAVLDLATGGWRTYPNDEVINGNAVAVDGRVVFPMTGTEDGGEVGNWGRPYPNGGIWDPGTGGWSTLPTPAAGGLVGWLSVVGDRTFVGGQLLRPRTREWTRVPSLPGGTPGSPVVLSNDDTVFVWGGDHDGTNLAGGWWLRVP